MSKSIKLKDEVYLDSSSVTHGRMIKTDGSNKPIPVSDYLTIHSAAGTAGSGSTRRYIKLFSIKPRGIYHTFYHHFKVVEQENVGFIFEGEILLHLDVNYVMSTGRSRFFKGNYTFNDLGVKVIMLVENNTAQQTEIGVYVYFTTPYNWRTCVVYTITSNALGVLEYSTETFETEPNYVYKTEI